MTFWRTNMNSWRIRILFGNTNMNTCEYSNIRETPEYSCENWRIFANIRSKIDVYWRICGCSRIFGCSAQLEAKVTPTSDDLWTSNLFSWEPALWTLIRIRGCDGGCPKKSIAIFSYKQWLLSLDMKTKVVQHVPSFENLENFKTLRVPSTCLTWWGQLKYTLPNYI